MHISRFAPESTVAAALSSGIGQPCARFALENSAKRERVLRGLDAIVIALFVTGPAPLSSHAFQYSTCFDAPATLFPNRFVTHTSPRDRTCDPSFVGWRGELLFMPLNSSKLSL